MTSETELAKEAKILDLFDSYPSASPSRENLQQYLASVEGLSLEAVTRSVQQFRAGLVERPNRDFAPSAETFAHNAREWERAINMRAGQSDEPKLHNGLLEVDYGRGKINMRGLTNAEQDRIMSLGGIAPSGENLAGLSLEGIRQALNQGELAQVDGGKSFQAPRLGRMTS